MAPVDGSTTGSRVGCGVSGERSSPRLDDGTALSPATAARLACDAAVVEVVEDFRGNVLDVGRRRRTGATTRTSTSPARVVPEAGGTFRFVRRDDVEVSIQGTPPPLSPDPVDTPRARHRAVGIVIDTTTNLPCWNGRPPDHDHVVWSLMAFAGATGALPA